jgi:hypothetical protein
MSIILLKTVVRYSHFPLRALRAARDSTAVLFEEAARTNAGAVPAAVQEGVERLEQILVVSRRIAWVSLCASIVTLLASIGVLLARVLH